MKSKNTTPDQAQQGADSKKKESANKVINMPSTPATEQAKPKAGTPLHNEGTNVSYEEER